MPILTVITEEKIYTFSFQGTPMLTDVLTQNGFYHSKLCGGRGICGKCAVTAEGAVSQPNDSEIRAGHRLACQLRLMGDAAVSFISTETGFAVETEAECAVRVGKPMPGKYGAAVDIGTTTLALKLYSLETGCLLSTKLMPNPQRSVSADIMGRISAAMSGQREKLCAQIQTAIAQMLFDACAAAEIDGTDVESMVITGNTTMLYLLTQRDPTCLSRAPFEMDDAFGRVVGLFGKKVYLPGCMHAFVGADISCAILAVGLQKKEHTALLCDIGTNGEMALWKNGRLYVTSTAAGPAFEGAGISCGCGSIEGAIDKAELRDGKITVHTIGNKKAAGLCGSGLIDAVAVLLERGDIDETGACEQEELVLADNVKLLQKDIRSLQLAKAAIAAGIQTLLEVSDTKENEVGELLIAGGFGSHLNVNSAAGIGLIPEQLTAHARAVGNAALAGAAMLLLDSEKIVQCEKIVASAHHVDLGGNPKFNAHYIDCMMFPET